MLFNRHYIYQVYMYTCQVRSAQQEMPGKVNGCFYMRILLQVSKQDELIYNG